MNSFSRGSLSVAAPFIIQDFGITTAMMGVALSAFFWTYVVGNLIGGGLTDRFGAKLVLGISFTIWSLFSAMLGFAHNVTHILLARLGVGLGEGPSFPCAAKVISGNFPTEERGTAIGINSAGNRVGLALCPLIMAYLISGWGWRMAFFITGIGSLAWLVLWVMFFNDKDSAQATAKEGAVQAVKAEPIRWGVLLRSRAILGLIGVKFTQDFLQWLFLTWVPAYLITGRHFSVMEMGFYTSLAFGVASIAQPFIGFLSDWLIRSGWSINSARKTIQIGLQLASATIIVTGYSSNVGVAMFFMVLAISAESTCAGHIWTIMIDVIPREHIGAVSGVVNALGSVAGIISPIVVGFAVQWTGNFQLALTIGGCSILIASAFLLFMVPSLNAPWYEALGIKHEPDGKAVLHPALAAQ